MRLDATASAWSGNFCRADQPPLGFLSSAPRMRAFSSAAHARSISRPHRQESTRPVTDRRAAMLLVVIVGTGICVVSLAAGLAVRAWLARSPMAGVPVAGPGPAGRGSANVERAGAGSADVGPAGVGPPDVGPAAPGRWVPLARA